MKNPCKWGEPLCFGRLGGTCTLGDPDGWFAELWSWLTERFAVRTMLDVGCGVGHAMEFLASLSVEAWGIDCEQMRKHHRLPERLIAHDLEAGPWLLPGGPSDFVWSCEVAEHVQEKCSHHLVRTLADNCAKVLAMTAAPPGCDGHRHVNCQPASYWVERLEKMGLTHRADLEELARPLCSEGNGRGPRNYFLRSGMIFTRGQ